MRAARRASIEIRGPCSDCDTLMRFSVALLGKGFEYDSLCAFDVSASRLTAAPARGRRGQWGGASVAFGTYRRRVVLRCAAGSLDAHQGASAQGTCTRAATHLAGSAPVLTASRVVSSVTRTNAQLAVPIDSPPLRRVLTNDQTRHARPRPLPYASAHRCARRVANTWALFCSSTTEKAACGG